MFADRLKKSLLQAAIQGKLTEQLPTDGDARDLLKKIRAEKAKLIAAKKIKAEKLLPPVSADEIPFDLPDNWCWCRLGEVALKIHYGFTASARPIGNVKLLRITDIQNDEVCWERVPRCTITDSQKKDYLLKDGDIVIARTGGTVGKTFVVENLTDEAVFASYLIRVMFNENISSKYIKIFAGSPLYWRQIIDKSQGTGQPNVNGKSLSNLILPLPPLTEQERIVEKLDALLSEVDELAKDERELVELEKNFPRRMRNSLLQAAIQGQLTEQLPTDGDARDLLKKIRAEKAKLLAAKKIKAEKLLPPITDDEIPFDLPDNWCWCRLGEVCEINPRNRLDDETIDATFLPMKAIHDGYGNGYNPLVKPWLEIKSGFTHFADGDVIFAKITPCFQNRKSAVVDNLTNGIGAGTTELYVLRPYGKQVSEKYLLYFLKNQQFIADGVATMKGTAGQQRISRDFVTNYLFPLPPLTEQKRIVERLDALLSEEVTL